MKQQTNTPYGTEVEKLSDLSEYLGKELGLSDWVTITQERINQFATATGDEQWIHVDVEKAQKFSPYGKTVAHGFMILSYASQFCYQALNVADVVMGVNYGLNKVRFPNAVPVGSKIRGRVTLTDFQAITQGARYTMDVVFELEGQDKPACVASFIAQVYTA
jgi:acyl dehydratase